jgi:dolichol kinase
MKKRGGISNLELRRNVFHIFLGILLVSFINLYSVEISLFTFAVIILLGLFISILSRAVHIPVVTWFLHNFEREDDLKTFPGKGALFFFAGSVIALYLYGVQIASACILILAVGDSVNILIGKPFGKIPNPLHSKKMIEGSIAGFIASFIVASFFVPLMPAIIASAVAMLIESIDFGRLQINDNILIPVFAGMVLYFLI